LAAAYYIHHVYINNFTNIIRVTEKCTCRGELNTSIDRSRVCMPDFARLNLQSGILPDYLADRPTGETEIQEVMYVM
jgi:hypothetical protein